MTNTFAVIRRGSRTCQEEPAPKELYREGRQRRSEKRGLCTGGLKERGGEGEGGWGKKGKDICPESQVGLGHPFCDGQKTA
jgi:hypothetical protein